MILAINLGNTHTSFCCIDNGNAGKIFKISTDRSDTAFGYGAKIKQVFDIAGINASSFDGAIISSVVPPLTDEVKKAVELVCGVKSITVGAGVKTGLHIAIDDPGTIAADLVATAVAAKEEYPLPCIIINTCTATTITVVDKDGKYRGGAIYPGIDISLTALAENASLLPQIELSPPQKPISSNTIDSMKSGMVYGSAGAVDGILDAFINQLDEMPSIVATGKGSHLLFEYCRHKITPDEKLLFKGLNIIYNKNER